MIWLLAAPVLVVAVISVVAALRRPPTIVGTDPPQLRTVVEWRDPPAQAHDIAGDAGEQLRQIVGALAERRFILASSIETSGERSGARANADAVAIVDVHERRFQVHARTHSGGKWLLWIDESGQAPEDSDEVRQLLSGLYRSLEERRGEGTRWHRREELGRREGAPSPFYVA